MTAFPFSGAILAGGRSSRMGRDKAFIEIDGVTLVARQAAGLRAAGAQELLISGRPEIDYAVADARVVTDTIKDGGPLAGLSALLKAARTSWVLVLAVDLPHISAEALNLLLSTGGGRLGAVPKTAHGYEPLIALYPTSFVSLLDEALARNQLSLQPLLERAEAKKILQPIPHSMFAQSTFANWNTPDHITGKSP
ncbi:MAG: molybdenum cofactor guanylyltransferase [Rariglobus sp.]